MTQTGRISMRETAKPRGWFSRRHETSEARDAAREAWRTRAERRPRQVWNDKQKVWVKLSNAA